MKKRIAAYVRVSTKERAEEGFSIPAQRERLKNFCLSQDWGEEIDYFVDDGWSAKDLNRPKINELIKDVKRGKVDVVLVYRLDRLTRSVQDLYDLLKLFEKHNVAFRSATEIYDTTTAMGRLFITLVAALAQWERENLGERVTYVIEEMIDSGKRPGGKSAYGYRFKGHDFNADIHEEEAKIVKKIFEWYAEGYGYRSIAKRLNELNVPTRTGVPWAPQTIRSMLINDIYIGNYRWGTKEREKTHKPIISEALFYKVQQLLANNIGNKERKGKFPLTGILKCGHCNENNMQGNYDKRDDRTYYRCLSCNRMTHDERILEALLSELEMLIASKEYFMKKFDRTKTENEDDFKTINGKLTKIRAQKDKWYDLYVDDNNPIPKEDLFERINKLNEQENELQLQLADIDIDIETPEEKYERIKKLTDFRKVFFASDQIQQKDLLAEIIEKVVITRERGRNKPIDMDVILK
ncbi:site-specific DNA recombinase [Evansella vedderi]|uniref:Site-specific DNA recombinase n=1 Tax=Evansella vedderi TaxID=38282 RepID=A0ABT9ZVJ3_9BACI|nr:recombinase family protein [Evansella vedderi]MDQ0254889.1 site-specific DNA recombinase [Evansella vedderi]